MNRLIFFICSIGFMTVSYGSEFSSISLKNWNKEELAAEHLRFTRQDKKDLFLHLQVDSFDLENFWNEESLASDIEKMASMRKTMSFFLGTTDYQITSYKLERAPKNSLLPRLLLQGSYRRIDGQLIQFSEINFYHKENFLQLKLISEGSLPSEKDVAEIIKELNPDAMDID